MIKSKGLLADLCFELSRISIYISNTELQVKSHFLVKTVIMANRLFAGLCLVELWLSTGLCVFFERIIKPQVAKFYGYEPFSLSDKHFSDKLPFVLVFHHFQPQCSVKKSLALCQLPSFPSCSPK